MVSVHTHAKCVGGLGCGLFLLLKAGANFFTSSLRLDGEVVNFVTTLSY